MDWNTFFKDNAQSIFTLGGVFLGSLITFFISYLNNRFQSKERDKDRLEQRREAKIQTIEKWVERDILKIMDSLEIILKLLSEIHSSIFEIDYFRTGIKSGLLTQKELKMKITSFFDKLPNRVLEVNQASDMIRRLVYSFEEAEIVSGYTDFLEARESYVSQELEYIQNKIGEESDEEIDTNDNWIKMNKSAGKFQQALREKLISLRE